MPLKRPFECQRCGRCCRRLGVPWPRFVRDLIKMAEFLKINEEAVVIQYYGDFITKDGKPFVRIDRKRTTPCPFLGEDNTCQIYPVRPAECHLYPLNIKLGMESPRPPPFEKFIGMDCPEYEDPP
jgi:Fe-S-cluster containining protein